jgi:hypothetical protein
VNDGASSFEPVLAGARCFLLRNASLASGSRAAMGSIPPLAKAGAQPRWSADCEPQRGVTCKILPFFA